MKTTLSENKIKFNIIQKMQAQLGVATNSLTVPRIETDIVHDIESRLSNLLASTSAVGCSI